MGTIDGPAEPDFPALNQRIRRVGVGGTVQMTFPPAYDQVDREGTVIARDRCTTWFSRELRDHERSLVLDRAEGAFAILVGYEPWHAVSTPLLYRRDGEGVPVLELSVVERGVQIDADRGAAALFEEVGRFGGP